MKNKIATTVAVGIIAALAGTVSADVGVTMDFASAYVFRGYTFNDGPVFQPGIEASGLGLPEEYGSVAVGVWGNYDIDDYSSSKKGSEFSEIDMYASYGLPTLIEGVDLSVGYCEYAYPLGGVSDKEVNVGAGFEVAGVSLGATIYQLIGGFYSGDTWYEFSAGYSMDLAEGLTGGVDAAARIVDSVTGESGFNDYTLAANVSYALSDIWSAGASVTYIGQGDDEVLADGAYGYDTDFVGMLSLAAAF